MTSVLPELVVRDARRDEADAIRELTLTAYSQYATIMAPAAWAGLQHAVRSALATWDGCETIVAEQGGRIVGAVRLYPAATAAYGEMAGRAPWPELRLLAVAAGARGLGVGRLLVEECMRRARGAGAKMLGLHTSASMEAAMRLYAGMGFERAPEHDFQPDGAELVEAYRVPL